MIVASFSCIVFFSDSVSKVVCKIEELSHVQSLDKYDKSGDKLVSTRKAYVIPQMGRDHVSGGISVHRRHAASVTNSMETSELGKRSHLVTK